MEKRNWYLFIHRKSFQVYAISPMAYPRYQLVEKEYYVVEGLTKEEAQEDVVRSYQYRNIEG